MDCYWNCIIKGRLVKTGGRRPVIEIINAEVVGRGIKGPPPGPLKGGRPVIEIINAEVVGRGIKGPPPGPLKGGRKVLKFQKYDFEITLGPKGL